MNKEEMQRAIKALERQEKQYKRQNNYIKEVYERQTVVFPKGTKDALKEKGVKTINEFLNDYVDSFLGRNRKEVLDQMRLERQAKREKRDDQ